jgi:hypothetical protein
MIGGVGSQEDALQWRVQGGEDALEPTARVRLIVDNRLPADVVDATLGMVQTAIYLYRQGSPAALQLATADSREGMRLAPVDPVLSSDHRLTTVALDEIADDDVHLGLVIGRDVAVVSAPDEDEGVAALRAVSADLMDRMRWSVDTLIGAGQERQVWEGNVVLVVDSLYADFLAVRSPRVSHKISSGGEAAPVDNPAGGILGISPTATPVSAVLPPGTRGTVLVRATDGRLNALNLQRGMLNVIRIIAEQSPTGDFVVKVEAVAEPLSSFPAR